MSHALLLRLFLSPSYFSVHLALEYLRMYADNLGITHYLTTRLRELSPTELQDVWGFICHLLITRPSKSTALETFVLERAELSTHIAILTLFYMQASMHDLAARKDTPSFKICHRVLNHCHNIVFGDPPAPTTSSPYNSPAVIGRPTSRFWRKKVKPHLGPAIVGIGSVLAGSPGMPRLTFMTGKWAIDQGRKPLENESPRPPSGEDDEAVSPTLPRRSLNEPQTAGTNTPDEDAEGAVEEDIDTFPRASSKVTVLADRVLSQRTSQHQASHSEGGSSSPAPSQTTPSLTHSIKSPRFVKTSDPFGQLDQPATASTPSIGTRALPTRTMSAPPEPFIHKYDPAYQTLLLRSHYCRSEIKFLQNLEEISNRLLVVPKPARVSALRAELTNLNHSLPAEVCMPMWCSSSDSKDAIHHHRIVRIAPGESVVLNSAERAPYLLLIEILQEDLDFDPSKRTNRDLITKIVLNGGIRPRQSSGLRRSNSLLNETADSDITPSQHEQVARFSADHALQDALPVIQETIPPTSPEPPAEPDEEVDLVEQLYGKNVSVREDTVDLTDSIVLPPPLKNKALEMKTWSSTPSTPMTLPVNDPQQVSTPATVSPMTLQTAKFSSNSREDISMEDYSERMRAAASMLAQLNANLVREPVTTIHPPGAPPPEPEYSGPLRWLPGKGWILGSAYRSGAAGQSAKGSDGSSGPVQQPAAMRLKLQPSEVAAITERIMQEMLALEEERMDRMRERCEGDEMVFKETAGGKSAEDEGIVRRELNKADPSAAVFRETWASKKARIRAGSPYGHLANWDCVSVIVKTGGDLRQEQLAVQLIQLFEKIWKEEKVECWVRYFRIVITGENSGLVETISDSVSIHSIKKAEYARRLVAGNFVQVTLYDHFVSTYGDPSSAKFTRAQRNFARSLAGYSIITYLLQIKDRHNGNILLDRDGHLVHIDFGFMLSNSPGNVGFEAAPFKLPMEYVELLGGLESEHFLEFKRLMRDGFEAARKHCDSIVTLVELMQKDSKFPCFAAFGEQTAQLLRDRFQPQLSHNAAEEFVERLIMTSLGSAWTRLYDSFQYYSQSIL